MCSPAARGRVLIAAVLLFAGRALAVDLLRLPDRTAEPKGAVVTSANPPSESGVPTSSLAPHPQGLDETQVIRDPLPPAAWSGGSMFVLGGAYAAFRHFRKRLTSAA